MTTLLVSHSTKTKRGADTDSTTLAVTAGSTGISEACNLVNRGTSSDCLKNETV